MKKKILLYVLLGIIIATSSSLFILYNKVQNVFDEMYYTWDKKNLFVGTKFKNVAAWEDEHIVGLVIPGDNVPSNKLSLIYDESYLKKNTTVSIWINPDGKNLIATCKIIYAYAEDGEGYIGGEKLFIDFNYDIPTKKLEIEPIRAISDTFLEKYPEKYEAYTYYDDSEYITMFMEEHNLTKDEIKEYRDYFLDEVLIGMWVDGNDEESRFDRNNAGKYFLEDNLFANLE